MTRYPKLPNGLSPAGAAGVRAIQATGGEFQTKFPDVGTKARRAGDFSRVEVQGDPMYLTRDNAATGEDKLRDVARPEFPFVPSRATLFGTPLGEGRYADAWRVTANNDAATTYTYDTYPGATGNLFHWASAPVSALVADGGYLHPLRGIIELPYDQGLTNSPERLEAPRLVAAGPGKIITTAPRSLGRTDVAGRALRDIVVYEVDIEGNAFMSPIGTDLTRPHAEYANHAHVAVTGNKACILVADVFFSPGPAPAQVPRLIAHVMDLDTGAMAPHDITSDVLYWPALPSVKVSPGGDLYHSPVDGAVYNDSICSAMEQLISVVLPGDAILYFFRLRAIPPSLAGTALPVRQHQRFVRISLAPSVTATTVHSTVDESGEFGENVDDFRRVQDAIHLGQGRVLIKMVNAFPGTNNYPVEFMYSGDGGDTWTHHAPTGFDTPSNSQVYFGNMIVHEPATPTKQATVLITAWSASKAAYHLYASKDGGASWVRRGRVAKPASFERIDAWSGEDGGRNYMELVPGPSRLRPLDVTLPDRYKKD